MKLHRPSFIALPAAALAFAVGCNTLSDPDPSVNGTANNVTDAGGDAATQPDADMTGGDAGSAARFEISEIKASSFVEPHELETSVALLDGAEPGHVVSLAYLYDPNFSGNDGFIVSTPVAQPDFSTGESDTISGNNTFKSVKVIRDPEQDAELRFSASFDNRCSSTSVVDNALNMYGVPGSTDSASASRDCETPEATINVLGNIERYMAVDDWVRFALITVEDDSERRLSTTSPVNSLFNYTEIDLDDVAPNAVEVHAAPGLLAVHDPMDELLGLWTGVTGDSPTGATSDSGTWAAIPLDSNFDLVAFSGASPSRYELWGASGSKLVVSPLPCSIMTQPLGHLDCPDRPVLPEYETTFAGGIIAIDATRSGNVALASVLTLSGGAVSRHLVVFDGDSLEALPVGDSLGDLVQFHISMDAFQLDNDRRLVAVATTFETIDQGSEIESEVVTFELAPIAE